MSDILETIYRVVITVGIGLFLWNVATSAEQIARALTRLADSKEKTQT